MAKDEYLSQVVLNQQKIHGFISSIHPFYGEIDDILQETNVTLLKKEDDFDSSKDFLPWAMAIARWTWMAYKQKRRRALERVTHFPEDVTSDGWDILIDPSTSDEKKEIADRSVFRKSVLNKASEKLSDSEQKILKMVLDGHSIKTIAEELNASYNAASARKRRLLIKLKKMVQYEASVFQEK